jgi:hypothetical protein
MLDNFPEDTTVPSTDNENFLWVGMRIHSEMSDHFLVSKGSIQSDAEAIRKLITFRSLNDSIKNEDVAVIGAFKYENILIFGFLDGNDFLDFQSHGSYVRKRHFG